VHFSKGTERRFKSDDVEEQYFLNRKLPETVRPRLPARARD
jgi:hypothetical protein